MAADGGLRVKAAARLPPVIGATSAIRGDDDFRWVVRAGSTLGVKIHDMSVIAMGLTGGLQLGFQNRSRHEASRRGFSPMAQGPWTFFPGDLGRCPSPSNG